MVGGADGSRVAGLQVWWAGVCLVVGKVRQMAKTNASPQNMLLIITEKLIQLLGKHGSVGGW